MSQQDILENLLKRVARLERGLSSQQVQVPVYRILNPNTPSQITSNQNNYDPGDYDLLWLDTDASRNITGFQGGVSGRVLWICNIGTNNIVITHNDASSSSGNRVICPAAANVTLVTRRSALLIYKDTNNWRMFYSS